MIENLGSRARASERVHYASKLGRAARWHQALHSRVCSDHDLRQVSVMTTDSAWGSGDQPEDLSTVEQHIQFGRKLSRRFFQWKM